MADFQREQIFAAKDVWRAAQKAYYDELERYVSTGWIADGPLPPPEKALDREGYRELMRLRAAAEAARQVFEDTLRRVRGH
jgi:hypothetical protein